MPKTRLSFSIDGKIVAQQVSQRVRYEAQRFGLEATIPRTEPALFSSRKHFLTLDVEGSALDLDTLKRKIRGLGWPYYKMEDRDL